MMKNTEMRLMFAGVFLDYIEFFAPDCQLHPNLFNPKIENGNSRQVTAKIFRLLSSLFDSI